MIEEISWYFIDAIRNTATLEAAWALIQYKEAILPV